MFCYFIFGRPAITYITWAHMPQPSKTTCKHTTRHPEPLSAQLFFFAHGGLHCAPARVSTLHRLTAHKITRTRATLDQRQTMEPHGIVGHGGLARTRVCRHRKDTPGDKRPSIVGHGAAPLMCGGRGNSPMLGTWSTAIAETARQGFHRCGGMRGALPATAPQANSASLMPRASTQSAAR